MFLRLLHCIPVASSRGHLYPVFPLFIEVTVPSSHLYCSSSLLSLSVFLFLPLLIPLFDFLSSPEFLFFHLFFCILYFPLFTSTVVMLLLLITFVPLTSSHHLYSCSFLFSPAILFLPLLICIPDPSSLINVPVTYFSSYLFPCFLLPSPEFLFLPLLTCIPVPSSPHLYSCSFLYSCLCMFLRLLACIPVASSRGHLYPVFPIFIYITVPSSHLYYSSSLFFLFVFLYSTSDPHLNSCSFISSSVSCTFLFSPVQY
jgi:hypothetical protein